MSVNSNVVLKNYLKISLPRSWNWKSHTEKMNFYPISTRTDIRMELAWRFATVNSVLSSLVTIQADIFFIISISTGLCKVLVRFHPWLKKLNWNKGWKWTSTNDTSMPSVLSNADGPKCYWPHCSTPFLTCFANSKVKVDILHKATFNLDARRSDRGANEHFS